MERVDAEVSGGDDRRRLYAVLLITSLYFATELAGGFYANSLALLTDALHMLTDIAALCLSLFTLWISSRPATSGKTYGYLRAEILGALFNGLLLWMLVGFVWFEAAGRLHDPPHVNAVAMMLIALVGVLVNGLSAWLTFARDERGRGMARRSVFVHVISDLLGCTGVLIAGAISWAGGWHSADPLVSFLIGGLIIYGSWGLVRDGVDILMESVPSHINLDDVRNDLLAVAGTEELHDLHVWCLASHQVALSAHAVVASDVDQDRVLAEIAAMLERKFAIHHVTVQLERDSRKDREHHHH